MTQSYRLRGNIHRTNGALRRLLAEGLRRIKRRPLRYVFSSPRRAWKVASRGAVDLHVRPKQLTLEEKQRYAEAGVSVHHEVLAYPLSRDVNENGLGVGSFVGGLTDGSTRDLIPEAVYYNGQRPAQSLPPSYVDKFSGVDPIKIGPNVMFAGIMSKHFGHFVSESISRLYFFDQVRDRNPFIFFYSPGGRPRYFEHQNFAHQILTGFKIPLNRVIFGDQFCQLDEVMVPEQKYGFGYLHDPDSTFVQFLRSFEFDLDVPDAFVGAERVYISRSRLGVLGSQIGESNFEEHLRGEGYSVFHPEEFTLNQQLSVYSSASKLVFAEGSALLSCILIPDLEADVAVICRRRDRQRNVRVATDCLRGFGKQITWIDAVRRQYQFGMETWEAMADIAWDEVSTRLIENDFTDRPYSPADGAAYVSQLQDALRSYLDAISSDARFLSYMTDQAEMIPTWSGPSHLKDPRSGRAIWPGPPEALPRRSTRTEWL